MKNIIILFSVVLFAACSAKMVSVTTADVKRGEAKFPGTTMASLKEGKKIYEEKCVACHMLKPPTSQTEEQWNKIVPIMVKKTNKKAGKEEIDPKKEQLILQYVVTMSTAPMPAK